MPLIKKIIFHIGGEDVRMRIPILKKMIKNEFLVAAIGCNDHKAFSKHGIKYFNYHLNRSISLLSDIRSKHQLTKIFKNENPDLIHLFDTKPGVLFPKVAKNSGIKHVVRTVTGMGYIFSSSSIFIKMLRPLYRYVQKKAIFYTDAVIFQNIDDKKYFEKYNLVHKNKSYLVASSGIDVESFISDKPSKDGQDKLRSDLGYKDNHIVVTLVARLIKDKGVMEFLKAARLLSSYSNIKFLVVGPIAGEGFQAISKSKLDSYADCVNYIGSVDNVAEILSISDIFVLPTYYREGLPRILLEAGSLGLPIIATDMPGCRDVVRHNWNGLLIPIRDPIALGEAIKKLSHNAALRQAMGNRNPSFIKDNFDLSIVADAYAAIYRDLLNHA